MVRIYVAHQDFIKRSGIIAASFLIASLAMVIINAQSASALLGLEVPLGKNLSPLTDRVNGLVNKSLGLPVKVESTNNLKVQVGRAANVNVNIPVVPKLVDGVTEPVSGVVGGVSNTLRPVTDNTVPAVRGALSRTLGGTGDTNTPAQPPATAPPTETATDAEVAGVSDTAPGVRQQEQDTEPTAPQTTFFGGVSSFFMSSLPSTLQDIARNIAGKEVGIVPIIISLLLFLMTMGAVGGIVYASNNGGVLALGRHKFALLAQGTDRTEMATFIVVAISFGVVSIFLALTSL